MQAQTDLESALRELETAVRRVESRVLHLESHLRLPPAQSAPAPTADEMQGHAATPRPSSSALEQEIGERWLGPVGIAVLLVGVACFIYYPFGPGVPPGLQVGAGYVVSALLLALCRRCQRRYPFTARVVYPGVLTLVFLSTLRLHFFTTSPVLTSRATGAALLIVATAIAYYAARRQREEHLVILALAMGLTTALCADAAGISPALVLGAAAAAVWLSVRRDNGMGVFAALPMAYLALLLWLLNDPFVRHATDAPPAHDFDLAFVLGVWVLFGVVHLVGRSPDALEVRGSLLAGGSTAGLFLLAAMLGATALKAHQAGVGVVVAAGCLVLASAYWLRRHSKLVTAVYACAGYVALSLAIVMYCAGAARFVWLGWQSLLVICTAIWFRSKAVVVANVAIYLCILLAYLLVEPPHLSANLSYAAVALLSARVMNWQRGRLDLRTEAMRNTYLASAFAIVLYGLYHAVPPSYVSLSWVGAALFYFLLSLVLGNRKYRWMAIFTMLLTVVYTFAVDLARLSPAFRVISLLVLGLALLAVSLMYARHRQQLQSADGRRLQNS